MPLGRRVFLTAAPLFVASVARANAQAAQGDDTANVGNGGVDSRLTPRIIGDPRAKVLVSEWFSLTCTHCAEFSKTVFPQIRKNLIDTGKIRYRFQDFPLDQVALLAAMLARSLPVDHYEPFVSTLFATQMQWAFTQGVDPMTALKEQAATAGISGAEFDRINADNGFRQAIVDRQDREGGFLHIAGTPYFRVNDIPAPKAGISYDAFARAVAKAS